MTAAYPTWATPHHTIAVMAKLSEESRLSGLLRKQSGLLGQFRHNGDRLSGLGNQNTKYVARQRPTQDYYISLHTKFKDKNILKMLLHTKFGSHSRMVFDKKIFKDITK
ncbi:hypothetical protein DPMN_011145 [Dreissena polymorpha]|uniref:Uncharacterized protein n=1 Tax=Dreissena polymorpha TaxID=45954 RepID=A0A9D4RZQ2_DREPO|nr:hypothetical protein DPMN_011145 [Dreissena polymorpha]